MSSIKQLLLILIFLWGTIFFIGYRLINAQEQAVKFAEWIRLNDYRLTNGIGIATFQYQVWYHPNTEEYTPTTEDLYNLYLKNPNTVSKGLTDDELMINNTPIK